MEMRLELVGVPVSDVDRAIAFYRDQVGFVLDHDHRLSDTDRFVQLTPPGSACSIALGTGIASTSRSEPVDGLQMVGDDIEKAREHLVAGGVEVSEVHHYDWGAFVYFSDPDGNSWALQQLPDYR
jgi:catechol 2,3-dioxygenase-like lactoylglutathione lyase family enzyme